MADPAARHSPLQTLAAAHGWPALLVADDVALREIPFVSQVNLRIQPDPDLVERVSAALGVRLPVKPNTTATGNDRTAIWLGPDEWLLVSSSGDAATVETSVRNALAPDWGSIVDVSANRAVLELRGPAARLALAKSCPLDLHPRSFHSGSCAQSLLAKALMILWQRDDEPTYWIFVRASFANYVAEWLMSALSLTEGSHG